MNGKNIGIFFRCRRFFQRPFSEKSQSLYFHWRRLFPNTPFPVRLPFSAWWLARNDGFGLSLTHGGLEVAERSFVKNFLEPGMTVLDIGAHHGLYTLLASRRVGAAGKVFAFEPSPRERKALRLHLRLNHCKNVTVHELALGDETSESELYIAEPSYSGFNSLKPPNIRAEVSSVRVHVGRLDDWIIQDRIERVEFVKLDVEGGELSVLQGAKQLLQRRPRPVILAEVQDIRTLPWGYKAQEIIRFLEQISYRWFALTQEGRLYPLDTTVTGFEGNFVACPEECLEALQTKAFTNS